jgi:hypothetical protein
VRPEVAKKQGDVETGKLGGISLPTEGGQQTKVELGLDGSLASIPEKANLRAHIEACSVLKGRTTRHPHARAYKELRISIAGQHEIAKSSKLKPTSHGARQRVGIHAHPKARTHIGQAFPPQPDGLRGRLISGLVGVGGDQEGGGNPASSARICLRCARETQRADQQEGETQPGIEQGRSQTTTQ